jgi:hypothetical protein
MASLGASSALLLCALPLLTAARCSSVRRTMRSFGLKACCTAVETSTHILQCQSDCTKSSTPCFTATLVISKRAIDPMCDSHRLKACNWCTCIVRHRAVQVNSMQCLYACKHVDTTHSIRLVYTHTGLTACVRSPLLAEPAALTASVPRAALGHTLQPLPLRSAVHRQCC